MLNTTTNTTLLNSKQILRSQLLTLVRSLPSDNRLQQSIAVTNRIIQLPEWQKSKCIGIYLSMENELQTHLLIQHAFHTQKKILVPKIIGKSYHDMVFYEAMDEKDISNFPRNRWGIPEPLDTYISQSSSVTNSIVDTTESSSTGPQAMPVEPQLIKRATTETIQPSLDLLIVPGVAFDSLCWRMGYGKGYYDNFIRKLRLIKNSNVTCIGVSLQEQIVSSVPHDSYDEQLDMVVTMNEIYRNTKSDEIIEVNK